MTDEQMTPREAANHVENLLDSSDVDGLARFQRTALRVLRDHARAPLDGLAVLTTLWAWVEAEHAKLRGRMGPAPEARRFALADVLDQVSAHLDSIPRGPNAEREADLGDVVEVLGRIEGHLTVLRRDVYPKERPSLDAIFAFRQPKPEQSASKAAAMADGTVLGRRTAGSLGIAGNGESGDDSAGWSPEQQT